MTLNADVQGGEQQNAPDVAPAPDVGAPASRRQSRRGNGSGEVASSGRDSRGRYTRDNPGAVVHGAYCRSLLPQELRAELRAAVLTDLGHTEEDVPRTKSALVDLFIGSQLIAGSYMEFLANQPGFAITTKGRQRRAVDGYLKAADRCAKFAMILGLDRQSREVPMTPREWLESLPSRTPTPIPFPEEE